MAYRRREVPLVITGLLGFFLLLSYVVINPSIAKVETEFSSWVSLLTAFSVMVGAVASVRKHAFRVYRRTKHQWYWSIYILAILFTFIVAGSIQSISGPVCKWMYDYMLTPLTGATYSMLVFYIFYALYKSMRLRSVDVGIFLVALLTMVVRNTPILIYLYPDAAIFGDWILGTLYVGVSRGVGFGAGIAAIILGIRVLTGREIGYLRPVEE